MRMMKALFVATLFLTVVWVYAFKQILFYRSHPPPEELFKDEKWFQNATDPIIRRDFQADFWESSLTSILIMAFTLCVSNIWKIWLHFFFGWFPDMFDEDWD